MVKRVQMNHKWKYDHYILCKKKKRERKRNTLTEGGHEGMIRANVFPTRKVDEEAHGTSHVQF